MSVKLNIKKNYGDFTLNISYESPSRRIGILGESGSGKSLTLKSIAGIEKPDSGYICVDGRVLYDKNICLSAQKRRVGYLFQSLALFPYMDVKQNIMAAVRGKKAEKTQQAEQIMERFALTELSDRLPSQLSQGQKQRVALGRILAANPEAILLDEPFSALDRHIKGNMRDELINMLKDFKGTLITVSHDIEELYALSDELMVIDGGEVIGCGKTDDILNHPPNFKTALLAGWENIASVNINDSICIDDFDISPKLSDIPDKISGVAIRADKISVLEGELSLNVLKPEIKKEPFGYKLLFYTSENAKKPLCVRLDDRDFQLLEGKIPKKLYINREDLCFFK